MNYDKLEIGMKFDNYKKICEFLNEEIRTGNSKMKQTKEWARYFNYTKQGNKFIITEIYEKPLDKYDARTFNSGGSIYTEDLETLIMGLIYLKMKDNEHSMLITRSQLMCELGIINSTYNIGRQYKYGLASRGELDIKYVNDFYQLTDSSLKSMLETALKKLEKRSLIDFKSVYVFKVTGFKNDDVLTDDDGYFENWKSINLNEPVYYEANEYETSLILSEQSRLLEKYNCSNLSEIMFRGLGNKFFSEVTEVLNKQLNFNIDYYFKQYKIIYTSVGIENKLKQTPKEELNLVMEKLNNNIKMNLIANAEKRKKESLSIKDETLTESKLQEIEFGWTTLDKVIERKHLVRSDIDYLDSNKKLIGLTMDRDKTSHDKGIRDKFNLSVRVAHENIIRKNETLE